MSSHDHSDMDMGGSSSSSSMSSSSMVMVFHTSISDPLFSSQWTPSNTGQYAGTCIFLIFFAVIYRALVALRYRFQLYYTSLESTRVVIVEEDEQQQDDVKSVSKETTITRRRVMLSGARPWRLSVDLPLSFLQLLVFGVSYLLMLAAMTFNVGYFLSILGGVFLGELIVGRYLVNPYAQ